MEKDTIRTYCKRNPKKELRRNPFDDLLPDQHKDVFKVFGWENIKHAGRSSAVDSHVSKRDEFKIYEDSRMSDDKRNREVLQAVSRKPRSATPIAQAKFIRVSKRPVRSPRISKLVTVKSSSEDDIGSGISNDEENWTTEATESSEDKTETEFSSIEFPREAAVEKIGFQEIDLPVKFLSSPLDQSTPVGTDESSELEMENRQRLNSTLLDDGFAKNIDELKGFMDVSPILKEATNSSMNEREERGEVEESERGYDLVHCHDNRAEEEKISLCLQHCSTLPVDQDGVLILSHMKTDDKDYDKRYLNCPTGFTMGGIKKFIRIKFDLASHFNIEVFHSDETLKNDYTLMDVAYLYAWRRLEPLKLYYIVYDSQKQKILLPKPENVAICEEPPRYVGKKRGRKRKHPPEDHPPVALSSRLKATIESMDSGKDLEDVGSEFTPVETATSASSVADSSSSSSSEESDQSDSEDDVVIDESAAANDAPPDQPLDKQSKVQSSSDGLIKRNNFDAVRSQLMNGDFGSKGMICSSASSTLSPAPGRTPLSSREFVVKKKKVETIDIALDPMDDFDMDGPGTILFPSKSLSSGSNTNINGNMKEKVVTVGKVTSQSTVTNKKVVKMNGFTPVTTPLSTTTNSNSDSANGDVKKKSANKLTVPKDSSSSVSDNNCPKPELMHTHSREHAYSKPSSKEIVYSRMDSKEQISQKINGKENTERVADKDLSVVKSRKDSSSSLTSSSPRAKIKESSLKNSKDHQLQHSSKPSSKEPTPPKGSHTKEPSPNPCSTKDSSPGSDIGSGRDKPLKIKIKCDTSVMDKKQGASERKSSLSPRSYVITSSTTPPEREPSTSAGTGASMSKKTTPGSAEGGVSGGHKRSRSSSSDSGTKSKDRRSGSLGRGTEDGMVTHYVTKLSPGAESGKSPPSQREPIKMIITKSQISPPLKTQISPPLKTPISPPLPLKSQLSPPLKLKISTVEPNQGEIKVPAKNKPTPAAETQVTEKEQTHDDKIAKETGHETLNNTDASLNMQTKTNRLDNNQDTKNNKDVDSSTSTANKSPEVSPSQVSPTQSKIQPVKKVDKRKSLEDKVFQLHKAKQNEQLQLLNRSTCGVSPGSTVSDGTVSTTDPYHFSETETPSTNTHVRTNGNTSQGVNGHMTVKMETQTKIKIKKDMGTSPSGPREVDVLGALGHRKPPIMNNQRLLKPQPQPDRKIPHGSQFIPTTPNLAKVLSQGKQNIQKPDSTTGDIKLGSEQSLLLEQQKQYILLQQQRVAAALQQAHQQKVIQQLLQTPSSTTNTGNSPQLLQRSLSVPQKKQALLSTSPLRAMHKLPTMAPTSPVGSDVGKPQAKRPRIQSGGNGPKNKPTGLQLNQTGRTQANPTVNGMLSYPSRPASVPPQFPPGPFVNGIMGTITAMNQISPSNQHSPPNVGPSSSAGRGAIPRPTTGSNANKQPVCTPPSQGIRLSQANNGFNNVFKDWVAQKPVMAHTSPPPPGNSPPAHMHSYPATYTNGLSPTAAHSTVAPIANGYDAPLELTTKKRTDSSSSDSKNNNTTNPVETTTILNVPKPNLMSLKT